ncbi:alpha/beta hydrolase [Actinoplanes awajinensis]|uniref:AB hydrolase-1 domain-containing protein n=1 Tax=Actinoplanes awajinensis subsp. mycoplanecinus TaxID=135947 RepID=A0A117MQC3_9ACTN|nr:alpha/beta fold hydrolase [Actinoplanes awajinensis]KUL30026.1 hypothetical protein ADL15_26010 [Actinoplanes awajinensis subsp. mycoplanecinus]
MRKVEADALEVIELAGAGRFAELAERFTPRMREVVSAETVRVGWSVQTGGAPCTPGVPAAEATTEDLFRVRTPVSCPAGDFVVVMSLDPAGRLHGLRLAPLAEQVWQPPRYAKPGRFTERDTGSGTLTLPRGAGPVPAVILLPGGGVQDRDGTHGADKPLKDLAWGLASRGVAVLRWDKPMPEHTLTEEYVTPALTAVQEMCQEPTADPDRIFLLGHSLGGKVAPRVAAASPMIAGLVLLAAEAMPMQRSAQRVVRHLAARDPGPAADAMIAAVDRQVATVDGDLGPDTPAADLPFGFPASYWLDLRGYDPVRTAAELGRPMLILQGSRDHQVTVADDLALWRAGLRDRKGVTIRVVRGADHVFHRRGRHVTGAVIRRIARWLRSAG